MSRRGRKDEVRFGAPIGVSVLLHAGLIAAVLAVRSSSPPALPPMYRVNIVAAPPGPRSAGVVTPSPPAPEPPKPAPIPTRSSASR